MFKNLKIVSLTLAFVLIFSILMPSVYALTDTYHFTSNEDKNIQCEDEFTFRNDCFKRSSFLGCSHLEILSAQVAEASVSWYGEKEDKYEVDYSKNGHNLTTMLTDIGFENVSTNKYYTLEKQENSAGVAVGYRTITVDNKDYTLLAIIPRSAGYKQEWAGNFTVGDGDIHEGFKSARDEILRYVNKYIKDNNIKGNIKVWTAGHSRGAALANMIGGFFAGGGIEYFGSKVSITPQDVYCYTFATPRVIKDGLSKNTELSVSANRTSANYTNDTPGESFTYTKGGTVNVKDNIYNGIRNLISPSDLFPMLPTDSWGCAHYGNDIPMDHGKVTTEAMLKELKKFSTFAYNKYLDGGDPSKFERKTLDLKTLSMVKDNGKYSAMDFNTFLKERLNGLTYNANTNKIYVDEGYQEVFKAIAGTYGMSMTLFDDDLLDSLDSLIGPLAYSYLAYASERLQAEGKASNEIEATTLALEELLTYFSGENINHSTFTFDDFMLILAKYIADNENEPIADTLVSGIVSLVPEKYVSILDSFKQFSTASNPTVEQGLKAYIKACYYGADPNSDAYESCESATQARQTLYMLIYFALGSDYPEIMTVLVDSEYNLTGGGKFQDFVGIVLKMLKTVKDDAGNVIKTYSSLDELADDELKSAIDNMFEEPLTKAKNLYGNEYKNTLNNHINSIKANISKFRKVALYGLLYDGTNFSAEKDMKNIATFIGNVKILPLAHYNEIYLAYAKAAQNYDCGYENHSVKYTCIKGAGQSLNITKSQLLSFTFDIDYDTFVKEGKILVDDNEVSRDNYTISKGSTIITFNEEFTKKLSLGNHTIKAIIDEGTVSASFTIADEDVTPTPNNGNSGSNGNARNPRTGDDIMIWVTLAIIAAIVLVTILVSKKKIFKTVKH